MDFLGVLDRFRGILGIAFFLLVAYLLSSNRKAINWRTVIVGLLLQLFFALTVLVFPPGSKALIKISDAVTHVIKYADEGSRFVFGWIAKDEVIEDLNSTIVKVKRLSVLKPLERTELVYEDFFGKENEKLLRLTPDEKNFLKPIGSVSNPVDSFIFAFRAMPIVIFISALFSILYYLGVMQAIVKAMAILMTKLMRVSGAEALASAANVFMGQTEAPIVIAPYLPTMTRSELMALMTAGMATVSGAVLGAYIGFGVEARYLITASVMAAPSSLVMAKMLIPETDTPKTAGKVTIKVEEKATNIIDAAAHGTSQGINLALNITGMLISFIALIYLTNGIIGWLGSLVGIDGLSLQKIFGYLFAPIAYIMGVPSQDILTVGSLMGEKLVINEFVAYVDFGKIQSILEPKSRVIATFALCGFANFSSIGIQIGGIGGLAPMRKSELAELGLRALLAGTMSSFMTATIAGILVG